MRFQFAIVLFAVVGLSSQRSTPQDDHYVAAVVEYVVNRNVDANRENYVNLIRQAAEQNADVVVFPELTLTNGTTSFPVPIHGLLQEYPVPALNPERYDDLLVAMSAAARDNQIYVVLNTRERMDCTEPQPGEECPEEKVYVFNTNVVFNREGAVIDRYRKINLFGEATHTPALKPDLGLFSTDFGVTFGHYICFDLMFQVPAVQVVQKHNVKDIIFTTMWFSEMPYLTAVQIQESYAYTMNVNFLGSGANRVEVGSAGSGIYSGKAGVLVSTMSSSETRLLVARVPKEPGNLQETYPGPTNENPSDQDRLVLIQDPSLPAHVTRPIEEGYQDFTIVDKDVSCRFQVRLANRTNTSVQYRTFVQDGTTTYARRELGVAACVLVACKNDDAHSCPYKFNNTEETPTIEELQIEMNTHRNQYNQTLQCDNIKYFPLSFRNNKYPLSPKTYTFTSKVNDESGLAKCESPELNSLSVFQSELIKSNNKETIKYKINMAQNEIVSFGIWGRMYTRDVDHNKDITDEDIEQFNTLLDRIYGTSSS